MSESLLLGALLAVAGGFFDAYTYLCRGGVFANAQTGNIVLFAVGVVAAEVVKHRYKAQQNRDINIHWRQIIVLAETVLVACMAFLPQERNTVVNSVISFVCALQVEAFRKVQGSAIATTMCTGNLRSGTEQLVIWRQTGDRGAAKKMRNYYAIILFFILGAVLGSFATGWLGERALLLTCAPLLAVFGIMFIAEEREERETRGSLEN